MNKHQRAKSRQIKKVQREMHFATYKEAKRLYRRTMRHAKRLQKDFKYVARQFRRGMTRLKRGISQTAINLAKLSLQLGRSNMFKPLGPAPKLPGDPNYVIDETAIESPTEMWPKENPNLSFETRRLGKFYFKEESDENH